ncbi:flagellar assembly protein FliH [Actinoplanes lutulentus]|uniref:Flagellar assembly protein FliH n=1 Tax=Actinoplanes lutulentus TaxID=1287878 RepID=A0A327ZE05_9ACTN|nr:FliH/SctL family protein [Actinoplanes lutulentus]MBB2945865.1 flagellar assembly protein FliH [Actinoplanes lutulentus]RAK37914.1 flagellar assembly protein FliH [Actinoplanes lutulentus]
MSSSLDGPVIRGAVADNATAARFAVDLRRDEPIDSEAVERAKQQARTTGYAEGWAQGKRDATTAAESAAARAVASEEAYEHRRAAALVQAVNALGRAVTELETQLTPTFTELQEVMLATAFELAQAIVGRSLTDDPERGIDAVRRAMSAAPQQGDVSVSLHPDDYQTLVGESGTNEFNFEGRRINLRPDPSLRPGDAVAFTGTATIDATIESAMHRAREALRI